MSRAGRHQQGGGGVHEHVDDHVMSGREMSGSYDSYGGGCNCCCGGGGGGGDSLSLPIIIAALAAATLFLFNAILAAAGKKRKKREQTGGEENVETVVDNVANVVWNGENLSISLLKNVL